MADCFTNHIGQGEYHEPVAVVDGFCVSDGSSCLTGYYPTKAEACSAMGGGFEYAFSDDVCCDGPTCYVFSRAGGGR